MKFEELEARYEEKIKASAIEGVYGFKIPAEQIISFKEFVEKLRAKITKELYKVELGEVLSEDELNTFISEYEYDFFTYKHRNKSVRERNKSCPYACFIFDEENDFSNYVEVLNKEDAEELIADLSQLTQKAEAEIEAETNTKTDTDNVVKDVNDKNGLSIKSSADDNKTSADNRHKTSADESQRENKTSADENLQEHLTECFMEFLTEIDKKIRQDIKLDQDVDLTFNVKKVPPLIEALKEMGFSIDEETVRKKLLEGYFHQAVNDFLASVGEEGADNSSEYSQYQLKESVDKHSQVKEPLNELSEQEKEELKELFMAFMKEFDERKKQVQPLQASQEKVGQGEKMQKQTQPSQEDQTQPSADENNSKNQLFFVIAPLSWTLYKINDKLQSLSLEVVEEIENALSAFYDLRDFTRKIPQILGFPKNELDSVIEAIREEPIAEGKHISLEILHHNLLNSFKTKLHNLESLLVSTRSQLGLDESEWE